MTSTLVKNQKKTFGPKPIEGWGKRALIKAEVRHDDQCGNGHNTFSITGEIYIPGRKDIEAGGCIHDDIGQHFPELRPLIKWHLCSTDGPLHYIANTVFHVKQGKFDNARSTAIWPEATDEDLKDPDLAQALSARLPKLMEEFQKAVESLGFTY